MSRKMEGPEATTPDAPPNPLPEATTPDAPPNPRFNPVPFNAEATDDDAEEGSHGEEFDDNEDGFNLSDFVRLGRRFAGMVLQEHDERFQELLKHHLLLLEHHGALRSSYGVLQEKNGLLRERLEDTERQRDNINGELATLRTKHEQVQSEYRDTLKKHETTVSELQGNIAGLKKEITRLKRENARLTKDNEMLEARVKKVEEDLKSQATSFKQQLEAQATSFRQQLEAQAAASKQQVGTLNDQFEQWKNDDAAIAPVCETVGFFYDVVLDKVNKDLPEDDQVATFSLLEPRQKIAGALAFGLTKQEWSSILKYKEDRNDKHHHIERQNGFRGLTAEQAQDVAKAVDIMFVPPKTPGLKSGLAKIIPLVQFNQ